MSFTHTTSANQLVHILFHPRLGLSLTYSFADITCCHICPPLDHYDTAEFNEIISKMEDGITKFWIELSKGKPDKKQMNTLNVLKRLGLIRFHSFRKLPQNFTLGGLINPH
jgi:hypothetical protein